MNYKYHTAVSIPIRKTIVQGELIIPLKAKSIVIFAHGSGSSRFSPRNQMVAQQLHENDLGTLLFDLLTREEDNHYHNRFDIDLLTKRLIGATEWLENLPEAKDCKLGYFGASTGAASALKAAALLPQISAVVSRGGRPDLAMDVLAKVEAPTLLIVGSLDYDVLKLNQQAYDHLVCTKKLEVVKGASHLFEEHGMMEEVSVLATTWFKKYLLSTTVHS